MAKQLGFHINSSVCANCKACQVACQDKNNLPAAIRWRRVVLYGGGGWVEKDGRWMPNGVFSYSVSFACMHCENPLCVQACPTGALMKRADGVVLINQDQCVGCRYCEWACPYGAPQFNEAKGVMTKCNFCEDLLAQGQNPACVDACPMRAIEYGDIAELRAKYGTLAEVEPLPSASITLPHAVVTPHRNAQASGTGTGKIMNLPEEL
ncbi:MAG: dimethylsulfoxide reductase subunit B [Chloroflexi bacterium]|nr:dimethylsulfoxide reductase subunit B [Chloroflexota bacterium]